MQSFESYKKKSKLALTCSCSNHWKLWSDLICYFFLHRANQNPFHESPDHLQSFHCALHFNDFLHFSVEKSSDRRFYRPVAPFSNQLTLPPQIGTQFSCWSGAVNSQVYKFYWNVKRLHLPAMGFLFVQFEHKFAIWIPILCCSLENMCKKVVKCK